MTEVAFQRALGRLVTDRRFRRRLGRGTALPAGLSGLERRRLAALAAAPGVALTARLIDSFRLGKLITLLPLTRALLGPARFAREAEAYCAKTPPTSFYLADEALAFCVHLAAARPRRPYLAEVVAYERAMIELKRPRPSGTARPNQRVVFEHDPARLLPPLARGGRPRAVPRRRHVAIGFLGADGEVDWRIESAASD